MQLGRVFGQEFGTSVSLVTVVSVDEDLPVSARFLPHDTIPAKVQVQLGISAPLIRVIDNFLYAYGMIA